MYFVFLNEFFIKPKTYWVGWSEAVNFCIFGDGDLDNNDDDVHNQDEDCEDRDDDDPSELGWTNDGTKGLKSQSAQQPRTVRPNVTFILGTH